MLIGDDAIVQLTRTVLAAIVSAYKAHGIDLPARRYTAVGEPVNDDEQLVVSYLQHYQGLPGDQASVPQPCNVPQSAVLTVSLVRCIPSVDGRNRPPTAADMQAAYEALMVDAQVLVDVLVETDPYGLGTIVTCEVGSISGGVATIVAQTVLAIP
jgi:hypothetical protein